MKALLETRRVFVVIFAVGLFAMSARSVTDPDVWWHLRTGQLIIQNHAVFHTDPYSFTRFGQRWVNHEWLSDVLIFGVHRLAGWSGLIVTFAVIIAGTLLLVFLRCPGRPLIAAFVTVWGALASAPAWGVRPQMFSLLLASIFLLILERSSERPNLLWWTIPLMLLWVNLHAGFAIGIVLLALFLIGEVLDVTFGFEEWPRVRFHLGRLVLVLAACLLVVPLNPNGARLYWYPLQTLHSPSMQNYIDEWFSPNFHESKYVPLLLMLMVIMAGLTLSPRRLRPRELLLLLVTMWAALRSVRHIPIFVLVAVPVLSGLVLDCLRESGASWLRGLPRVQSTRRTMLLNAIVLASFVTFTVVRVRYVADRQAATEGEHFPVAAASFISRERPAGPILNHYNWGGYFIWKLYPEYRVFVDGRADLYGDSFLDDFASVYFLNKQWYDHLRQWKIRTVVLPPDAPIVTALRSTTNWKQIYADSQVVILTIPPAWDQASQSERLP
jgi:hypothetical protein